MDPNVIEFFQKNKDKLDNLDEFFDACYNFSRSSAEFVGKVTEILEESGIDVLHQVNRIYQGMFSYHNEHYQNQTSITIPKNIITIGTSAFQDCTTVKQLIIEPGLKVIGRSAFNRCNNLQQITLPATVYKIKAFAFFGCYRVKTFEFEGTVAQWNENDVEKDWCATSSIKEITCKDGKVELY